MNHQTPQWKPLKTQAELDFVIEESKNKPVLILKHDDSSEISVRVKSSLEKDWAIPEAQLNLFVIDGSDHSLCAYLARIAGIENQVPQIILFADGVTMYDESNELITFKKIKLALKIVVRTFRWMETRA